LAARLDGQHNDPAAAIQEAFRRIVCRPPSGEELEILQGYYLDELEKFSANPEDVVQVVSVGEYPMDKEAKSPEIAAMMQVIVALYNLEETITKT
jgi:hypothetical protein